MRLQLTGLLHRLVSVQEMIAPGMLATEQAHRSHTVMMQVNKHLDTEHRRLTGRAEIIDERKNNAATQLRAAETARKRDAALARQKELEERARAKEQEDAARARAKRQQELQDLKHKQALDKIAQIKRTAVGAKALDGIDENELKGLDPDAIVAKQVEQLDKEKRDLEARKRAVERKMDHFERACREEEVPLLEKQWQDQQVSDRAWWEADVGQQRELHRRKYDTDLSLKKRMQRIAADHAAFKERLHERAQEALSKRMAKFEKFLADQRKIRENERAQREKREAEQRAIQAEQERIEEAEREERRQKDLIVARERSERQRLDAERLERAESTSWKRSEPSSRPPRDFDTRSDTSGGSGGGGGGGGGGGVA
jgi:translation initiation factor 3 subunit A